MIKSDDSIKVINNDKRDDQRHELHYQSQNFHRQAHPTKLRPNIQIDENQQQDYFSHQINDFDKQIKSISIINDSVKTKKNSKKLK